MKQIKPRFTKDIITKFGELIYSNPDVEHIIINVNFKNGIAIGFRKSRMDDYCNGCEE